MRPCDLDECSLSIGGVNQFSLSQPLNTNMCLFYLAAQNEGSIHMNEGEVFSVVEQDQGDGWTRVQRKDGLEGFVPTSYIQIQWY